MWGIVEVDGLWHCVPTGESHITENCSCGAAPNEDGLIVHNAFDEREKFETGERKPS